MIRGHYDGEGAIVDKMVEMPHLAYGTAEAAMLSRIYREASKTTTEIVTVVKLKSFEADLPEGLGKIGYRQFARISETLDHLCALGAIITGTSSRMPELTSIRLTELGKRAASRVNQTEEFNKGREA
jgi:hypothetical protein